MAETSSVGTFIEALKKRGPTCVWQRFEDKFSPGIPDLNVCFAGREIWVEAKWLASWPVREATGVRVPLRKEQVVWARTGATAGRTVRCLLRVANWGWACWDAEQVDFGELRDGGFGRERALELAMWSGRTLDVTKVLT